jgi:hypothetical protein
MWFALRLARVERLVKAVVTGAFPTCIAYIPCNGRGDIPPSGTSFRSGPSLVVVYDPVSPPEDVSDAWLDHEASRS